MDTQIVPEVQKLKDHLNFYRRTSDEAADFELKCGQAKADKAAALADHSASEADTMKKASEAQTRFEFYSDRLEGKRLTATRDHCPAGFGGYWITGQPAESARVF